MSLSNLKTCIQVLAVIAGFASAAFWWEAASINPPWAGMIAMMRRKHIRSRTGTRGGSAPDVLQQLKRQSTWNARAAFASAISAGLQIIALVGF
jgi:hypothetical protein